MVFARNEFDPNGPIDAKIVQEKFERTGRVLHLHLPDNRIIRTTPEHPFYVADKGWTAAGALESGDQVRTAKGWATVEDLFDTGEYEKVYNIRVADWHTYFVSDGTSGKAVWAHNTYEFVREATGGRVFKFTEAGGYEAEWFVPNAYLKKNTHESNGRLREAGCADRARQHAADASDAVCGGLECTAAK